MTVTFHRAGASGRLNIDIAEHNARVHTDRRHMGDVDRVFGPAEPVRGVVDDRRRGDLNLGREQVVAGAETARAEHLPRRKRPPFSPDDQQQGRRDGDNRERGNKPGRLKIDLSHKPVMLS